MGPVNSLTPSGRLYLLHERRKTMNSSPMVLIWSSKPYSTFGGFVKTALATRRLPTRLQALYMHLFMFIEFSPPLCILYCLVFLCIYSFAFYLFVRFWKM